MIVISAGMQKSGSAYIYNLDKELQWHINNNIGVLKKKILIKLIKVSFKNGKFTVQTHSGPTRFYNILLKLGLIKTIYIYREIQEMFCYLFKIMEKK